MGNTDFKNKPYSVYIPSEDRINEFISCKSSKGEISYKIHIKNRTIKCTCKDFEIRHNMRGTSCKHIRQLAKSILNT
jgi:hypothetical protein